MKKWWNEKGQKEMAALCLLAATPVTAFFLMQWIYAGSLDFYPFYVILGNGVCLGTLYYMFAGLTGRLLLGSLITHLTAGILGAANYFVASFRGNPVLPWDLTALGTAAAVSGSYRFRLTGQMVLALALGAAAALGLFLFRKKKALRLNRWRFRAALLVLGFLCLYPVTRPQILEQWGITTDVWNQQGAYEDQGILASFLCNTRFMEVEKPEGYSQQAYRTLLGKAAVKAEKNGGNPAQENLGLQEGEAGSTRTGEMGNVQAGTAGSVRAGTEGSGQADSRPHVIAIMNESWADFEEFGNLDLNRSVMDEIRQAGIIFGHAYTSVFGAGTSASEFEFLTGNTMAFLPSGSIPYQQYILKPQDSLASLLKNEGYRCLALHPGERDSWQRNRAYPLLGFEEFLCEDDMQVPLSEEHGYVSDASSFDQLIRMFEERQPGERLFLFNVTIQNHGSYTDEDYPAQVRLMDQPGAYPMAEQYLTLEGKTQEAFLDLIRYFEGQEEPVVILMFGDHQPAVEQEFLDKAYGVKQEDMTMLQYMNKFRVPYVIWANYDLPSAADMGLNPDIASLNFLSQYLLECAGISGDDYGKFLREVSATLPALTFAGYLDSSKKAYSHLETNGYAKLIEEYQTVQYGRLFGDQEE